MVYCFVPGCSNNNKRLSKKAGVTFHAFPVSSKSEWLRAIGRANYSDPIIQQRICSDHFNENDFEIGNRTLRTLKKGVLPSLHLPIVDIEQPTFPKDKKRRTEWIQFLKKPEFTPKSSSVLCSHHFADDCFDRTSMNKVRLLPNAIPTIEVDRLKYVRTFNPIVTRPIKFVENKLTDPSVKEEPDSSDIESNEKIPSVLSADTQFMRTIMREKPMDRSETSIPTSFTDIGQDEQQESELYCRLCFCVSTDSNNHINIFPSHGENSCRQEKIQQMILNIIPDLDLSLTYNPGICTDCERRLVDTYDFIMLSIYNQNTIIDYKSKHSDEVYVKIQDVVKPSNDTSNKRPMPELSYFPSKKVRTSIGNTNRTETGGARGATEVEEVTIKEEFDFDVFESVEGTEKQSVEEHSCTDLSTTSADKDIRDMELTKDSAPDFEKLITKIYKIPDRKEENRSGQENTIKLVDISSIIRPAETIRVNAEGNRHSHMIVEGTKIKVIRAQKSDISKS